MSSSSRGRGRIAIVDEDDAELGVLLDVLSKDGHAVLGIPSAALAAAALPLIEVDLVITTAAAAHLRREDGPSWIVLIEPGEAPPDPGCGAIQRPLSRAAFLAAVDFAMRAARADETSLEGPAPTRVWRDALSLI